VLKSPDNKTDIGEAAEVDRSATTKQTVSKTPPVDTETTLQWGKPVNGLRAALSRLPSVGEPKQGQVWDFDVVVQNVSDTPIRFVGDVTSPNIRRVTLRRDNKTLFRLISNEPSDVDVILQPREVVVLPVFPPNEAEKAKSMAENPAFTFHVMMKVEQAPAGAWTGELRTPDVSGAVISGKQPEQEVAASVEPKPKSGEKISDEVEQKLMWGKTVNGVRAAMMIRDTPEVLNEMFIVLQNVSETPIHIDDSAGENERSMILRFDGILESVMSSKEPRFGNVLLQPRRVVVAHAFSPQSNTINGMTLGSVMAANLFHDPSMSYNAEVKIENVPAGTWKGTLTTANSTGLDAAPADLQLGTKLDAEEEQRLQWGEASNGLRAALAIRNAPDDADTPDLYLTVQNPSAE
jgi:hypothetical protein